MKLFAPPSSEEWLFIAIIFVLVVMMIGIAELMRPLLRGNSEITRKSVHIIAGILMAYSPSVFSSAIPVLTIAAGAAAGTFVAVRYGLLQSLHGTGRTSYGTVIHPFSFLILVFLLWDDSPVILSLSIMLLAVPDALASIVGGHVRSPHIVSFSIDQKTYEGSAVMFGSSVVVILLFFWYHNVQTSVPWWIIAVVTAAFVTAWELLCSKGWDNLSIPLGAAFVLSTFLMPMNPGIPAQMVWGSILGAVIGLLSFRYKLLSLSGSIATFILGSIVFGLGGWHWTAPILVFFVSSSLLSKLGRSKKRPLEKMFDKTDKRDAGQVAANGGIAGVFVILRNYFPEREELTVLYAASLAAVTADTWGTEIGTMIKGKTRSLITFRSVEAGTSGGISLAGLAGGAAGAFLVALSAHWAFGNIFSSDIITSIVVAGMAGSLTDSIAGGTIQALYRTNEGNLTEKSVVNGVPSTLIRGFRIVTNDVVNWLCAAAGAVSMYFLL